MPTKQENKQLFKALQKANANMMELKMASILLAINGLDDALEFVHDLPGQQEANHVRHRH